MDEMKPIPDFPDYCITRDGRVWSTLRHGRGAAKTGRWLKLRIKNNGYRQVALRSGGKYHYRYVHRLVLEAFKGSCPEGMECCHANGNRADNRLENLRWDTPSANQADRIRHGTVLKGEALPQAKLTSGAIRDIRAMYISGCFTQGELGQIFGLHSETIGNIIRKRVWI